MTPPAQTTAVQSHPILWPNLDQSEHSAVSVRMLGIAVSPGHYHQARLRTHAKHPKLIRQVMAEVQTCTGGIPVQYLRQMHTCHHLKAHKYSRHPRCADAAVTSQPRLALSVYTADCLPLLITNKDMSAVCAIHAGWRGLYCGIIEKTLNAFPARPGDLKVWIGPAICGRCYHVDAPFKQYFCSQNPTAEGCFHVYEHQLTFDCRAYALQVLSRLGVHDVSSQDQCTHGCDHLPSYRGSRGRDSRRLLSIIWRNES